MTLGERIREVRSRKGLNRYEFAAMLGIHPQTLFKYEKNIRTAKSDVIKKIAETFSISVEWLLSGTGDVPVKTENPTHQTQCANCLELYKKLVLSQERELALTNENNALKGKIDILEARLSPFADSTKFKENTA
jgi:transcriptional regulator with XRE-family HTH domain